MSQPGAGDAGARQGADEHDTSALEIAGRQEQDEQAIARQEALRAFWLAVKRIPAYVRLSVALARDDQVPYRARAMLLAGGAYMVSPLDLVPGVIPVAGQLDDLYVLLMAIRQAIRMAPPEIAQKHLMQQGLSEDHLDRDLRAIRQLVKVGIVTGARWGWNRLQALRSRVGERLANRRKGQE